MSDELKACIACGHATPHERGEYEDTHQRCEHKTMRRHVGPGCGHKRWRKTCEDADLGGVMTPNCYSTVDHCYCSSEDREIAELKAQLATRPSITEEDVRKAAERLRNTATDIMTNGRSHERLNALFAIADELSALLEGK